MTSLLLVVALAQAPQAPEPEVFVDRGETYVRMGFTQGLSKGVTVDIVSADRHAVIGTAVVMEVWDGLARINLDAASTAYRGQRLARQRGAAPVQVQQAPAAVAIAPPPAAPTTSRTAAVAPPPPPPPVVAMQRTLMGKVSITSGVADARRVIVENLDAYDWHNCMVVLPDGRGYEMNELTAHNYDGIMMFRFQAGEATKDPQGLALIRCTEGAARFVVQL
jgi:hypothetical protein